MKKTIIAGVGIAVLGIASFCLAGEVTLAWDPNTEPDLAGYKVYHGTQSRSYGDPIDVQNVTQVTLTDLTPGQTYYFAATAYDNEVPVKESAYSEELVYTLPLVNTSMGDVEKMRKKAP